MSNDTSLRLTIPPKNNNNRLTLILRIPTWPGLVDKDKINM